MKIFTAGSKPQKPIFESGLMTNAYFIFSGRYKPECFLPWYTHHLVVLLKEVNFFLSLFNCRCCRSSKKPLWPHNTLGLVKVENNVKGSEASREWQQREQRQACWVSAPEKTMTGTKPEILDQTDICIVLWFYQELSMFLGSFNCPNSTCTDPQMPSDSDQLL